MPEITNNLNEEILNVLQEIQYGLNNYNEKELKLENLSVKELRKITDRLMELSKAGKIDSTLLAKNLPLAKRETKSTPELIRAFENALDNTGYIDELTRNNELSNERINTIAKRLGRQFEELGKDLKESNRQLRKDFIRELESGTISDIATHPYFIKQVNKISEAILPIDKTFNNVLSKAKGLMFGKENKVTKTPAEMAPLEKAKAVTEEPDKISTKEELDKFIEVIKKLSVNKDDYKKFLDEFKGYSSAASNDKELIDHLNEHHKELIKEIHNITLLASAVEAPSTKTQVPVAKVEETKVVEKTPVAKVEEKKTVEQPVISKKENIDTNLGKAYQSTFNNASILEAQKQRNVLVEIKEGVLDNIAVAKEMSSMLSLATKEELQKHISMTQDALASLFMDENITRKDQLDNVIDNTSAMVKFLQTANARDIAQAQNANSKLDKTDPMSGLRNDVNDGFIKSQAILEQMSAKLDSLKNGGAADEQDGIFSTIFKSLGGLLGKVFTTMGSWILKPLTSLFTNLIWKPLMSLGGLVKNLGTSLFRGIGSLLPKLMAGIKMPPIGAAGALGVAGAAVGGYAVGTMIYEAASKEDKEKEVKALEGANQIDKKRNRAIGLIRERFKGQLKPEMYSKDGKPLPIKETFKNLMKFAQDKDPEFANKIQNYLKTGTDNADSMLQDLSTEVQRATSVPEPRVQKQEFEQNIDRTQTIKEGQQNDNLLNEVKQMNSNMNELISETRSKPPQIITVPQYIAGSTQYENPMVPILNIRAVN
jgi:hypothetical protein